MHFVSFFADFDHFRKVLGETWAKHLRKWTKKREKPRKTKKNEAVRFVFMSETNVIFLWPKRAVRGKSFVGAVHFFGNQSLLLCSFERSQSFVTFSWPFRYFVGSSFFRKFSFRTKKKHKKNKNQTKTNVRLRSLMERGPMYRK